ATCDGGTKVRLWDAQTGNELRPLTGNSGRLRCARFSPDGERLVSGDDAGTVILWDVATGQEALRLKGGHPEVWFSADGTRLFSAGSGPAPGMKVWEAGPAGGG